MSTFSQRFGFQPQDVEISIRHEAPEWLRDLVVNLAYQDANLKPSDLRSFLCSLLLISPDGYNWSEFPNIDGEVRQILHEAEWFHVYDLIEWIYQDQESKATRGYSVAALTAASFQSKINEAFRRKGVGWQMINGKLQVRGNEMFEESVNTAVLLSSESGRKVARSELHEALRDLSRRPTPEITGAIQHSMAALECVARDITKEPKLTLGEWLKKNPSIFPQPLGSGIEKLWGYASQFGRHVEEGKPANYEEAELVVGLAGALSTYLLRKG